jgi:ribonuclease HI
MELLACVEALEVAAGRHCPVDLQGKSKVDIYTDSEYVAGGYRSAQTSWPANKWMTKDGNPVLHAKMWKDLLRAAHRTGRRGDVQWAKGHTKNNPHNKTADKLAKQSSGNAFKPPVTRVKVRRKRSEAAEVAGSVELHGQRMTVRIITSRYLKEQKMFHYK